LGSKSGVEKKTWLEGGLQTELCDRRVDIFTGGGQFTQISYERYGDYTDTAEFKLKQGPQGPWGRSLRLVVDNNTENRCMCGCKIIHEGPLTDISKRWG